jgi:hypothetical protein
MCNRLCEHCEKRNVTGQQERDLQITGNVCGVCNDWYIPMREDEDDDDNGELE